MKALKSTVSGAPDNDVRATDCYAFGPFRLNGRTCELSRDGEVVALTPKAFDTLRVLVTCRDRVVEKDELMKLVWPDSFVGDDTLTQNIATLRKALGDASDQPRYIATVPRRGYRFVASVRHEFDETNVPAVPAHTAIDIGTRGFPGTIREDPSRGRTRHTPWTRMWVAVSTVALLVVASLAIPYLRRTQPPAPSSRFVVYPAQGTTLVSSGGVLSPDGRHLAFVAQDLSGKTSLWVRDIDSVDARSVPGTEGAWAPFWSPASEFIAFFAQGMLKRVGLSGTPPQILTSASVTMTPAGGTWNAQGLILFAGRRSGLFSVPAAGGTVMPVTTLDPSAQEFAHRWPQFLPDGRHFLYWVASADGARQGVYAGSLDATVKTRVLESESAAAYAVPGYLFFVRERALIAQSFDVASLRLSGAPTLVAGALSPSPFVPNGLEFSLSNGGVIAYTTGNPSKLAWFNRSGEPLGALDAQTELHNPVLSLDGKRLAANDAQPGIWLFDIGRGVGSPWVSDATLPVWSPDGTEVVFSSRRVAGVQDLYLRSPDGPNDDVVLARTGHSIRAQDWSVDGRFIVFVRESPTTKLDLWLLPLFGDRKPVPYLQSSFNEVQGQVSPDGHWMAYASDESGAWEVYVQSFPVPGRKQRISNRGGAHPKWRRDGKELFYLALDHMLMAVDAHAGPILEIGSPKPLFQTHTRDDVAGTLRDHYAVTADGQRFIVDTAGEQTSDSGMTVLVNWIAALRK